jgi:aminoglycoside phosphotransferase (APT) family kinase protein
MIKAWNGPPVQMHDNQLTVLPDTVRDLVRDQFPEWRDLRIQALAAQGTDNAIFRVGEELSARYPLRPADVGATRRALEDEAQAAHELAGRTRFPTPEPIALGEPGRGYPLPWSVQTWIPGKIATPGEPAASVAFAHDLAEFIRDLRAIDTRGRTFRGSGRGGELRSHDAWVETCLEKSGGFLDVARLRRMWAELRQLPREAQDAMTHGDLIPGNVLVMHERLAGVLDVGGFGPADPALDLVSAWHLLEAGPRRQLREALGCDDLEWQRGKAWAFQQAMGAVWYYRESNQAMSHMGQVTLERLIADEQAA